MVAGAETEQKETKQALIYVARDTSGIDPRLLLDDNQAPATRSVHEARGRLCWCAAYRCTVPGVQVWYLLCAVFLPLPRCTLRRSVTSVLCLYSAVTREENMHGYRAAGKSIRPEAV